MTTILDPTSERLVVERERLARPASLEGLTVGLLDISKPRGDVFLDGSRNASPASAPTSSGT